MILFIIGCAISLAIGIIIGHITAKKQIIVKTVPVVERNTTEPFNTGTLTTTARHSVVSKVPTTQWS